MSRDPLPNLGGQSTSGIELWSVPGEREQTLAESSR